MSERYAEAFVAIVDLARALGVSNIKALPGCWERQVDEQTWIAVNGHHVELVCSRGLSVPPYHAAVEINGWPHGLISPLGGTLIAGIEDELIDRLRAAAAEAL